MYAIYGNIYHQYTPNVSIYVYIPYMDPMGYPTKSWSLNLHGFQTEAPRLLGRRMGRPFAAGGLHDGNGRGHGRELILHGSHGSAEGEKLGTGKAP